MFVSYMFETYSFVQNHHNDLSQIIEKVKVSQIVSMEIEGPIYESTSMPSEMLNVPFILKIYMVD